MFQIVGPECEIECWVVGDDGNLKAKYNTMIAPNSSARKGGKERGEVKGEYGRTSGDLEGNIDYDGILQPSNNMLHHLQKGFNGDWA